MPVKISKISENPINLTEITESVLSAECGADVTFVGRVRNQDSQKQVIKLIYEAHPEASKQIMEISKIISKLFPEVNISTVHRVGELKIGDIAFVVAAASAHRDEALNACRALVESVKANAPIWKNQFFSDGTNEWVNSP